MLLFITCISSWYYPLICNQIYEIGGGSGTCAKGIMDYIMLNAPPKVYNSMTYTYVPRCSI